MTSVFFTWTVQEPSAVLLLGRAEAGKAIGLELAASENLSGSLAAITSIYCKGYFLPFSATLSRESLAVSSPCFLVWFLIMHQSTVVSGSAGNGSGMVTWWAAAQHLSLSLRKARLPITLDPKHSADSQRLTPTGIIDSLWKVLSTGERKETNLENFVSNFRWLILFFLCMSRLQLLCFPPRHRVQI